MLAGGLEYPVIARFVAWIPSGIKNGFSESSWMRTVCLAVDMRLPPPTETWRGQLNLAKSAKIQHHLSELSQFKKSLVHQVLSRFWMSYFVP